MRLIGLYIVCDDDEAEMFLSPNEHKREEVEDTINLNPCVNPEHIAYVAVPSSTWNIIQDIFDDYGREKAREALKAEWVVSIPYVNMRTPNGEKDSPKKDKRSSNE